MALVRYNTLDEIRVGAWVLAPADASRIRHGFVVGHGYGGRSAPQWPLPFDDAVYIFPCAPGFDLSAAPGIPDNAAQHVVFGIASRETYLLRACFMHSSPASLMCCATTMRLLQHSASQLRRYVCPRSSIRLCRHRGNSLSQTLWAASMKLSFTVADTLPTLGRKMNCDRRSNAFEIGSTEDTSQP
jgi:hypothetical protein